MSAKGEQGAMGMSGTSKRNKSTGGRTGERAERDFFLCDPVKLARKLLGRRLVRVQADGTRLSGRIVETEAYLGIEDRAAHTWGGRHTERNHSMWMEGGHAYVYFTYGMHHCLNVVSETAERPTACLIRAIEPLEGLERMKEMRAGKVAFSRLKERDLCSGPAKLCQAMGIDRGLDGEDLARSGRLFIELDGAVNASRIDRGPRVGIGYAGEWADKPLRFFVRGNEHVSG